MQGNLIEAVKPTTQTPLQSMLRNTYKVIPVVVKKKRVLIELLDWEIDAVEEIQSTYQAVCGEILPASQVLKTGIREHLKKTLKEMRTIKTRNINKQA